MDYFVQRVKSFDDYLDQNGDPRVAQWFLMQSPLPTYTIIAFYIYFVKVFGPNFMKNREPFQLTNVILIYNCINMLLNAYLFYEFAMSGWLTGDYNIFCQEVDYSDNPQALRLAYACRLYFYTKFFDLFDTVFFVLRKKNQQISTLHVFHHSILPTGGWWGLKFSAGGQGTFFCLLNSFVHVIMYIYYLLSSLGPKVQKYLWWKKYITILQLVQFQAVIIHSLFIFRCDSNFPRSFTYGLITTGIIFHVMFYKFYKTTYNKLKAE